MGTRSPNYPALSLEEAIKEIRKIHSKDMRNRMSRRTAVAHMGYASLSGPALGKIGALRAYGLLEGQGDDLRVSEDAVLIIADEPSSKERQRAIREAAFRPKLFRELNEHYEGRRPSEQNLRSELIKREFTETAVSKVIAVYLVTFDLVSKEGGGYDSSFEEGEIESMKPSGEQDWSEFGKNLGELPPGMRDPLDEPDGPPPPGMRRAVFVFAEGDVTLMFPEILSQESVEDLQDYLNVFLRKLKREAGMPSEKEKQN